MAIWSRPSPPLTESSEFNAAPEDEEVAAAAAARGVRAAVLQLDEVRASAAGDFVVIGIAAEIVADVVRRGQVFHVDRQHIDGEARADLVRALAADLGDRVAGVIDEVEVITRAARHAVGSGAAVESVVAAIAGERVVAAEAERMSLPAPPDEVVVHVGAVDVERGGRRDRRRLEPNARRARIGESVDIGDAVILDRGCGFGVIVRPTLDALVGVARWCCR